MIWGWGRELGVFLWIVWWKWQYLSVLEESAPSEERLLDKSPYCSGMIDDRPRRGGGSPLRVSE